MLIPSTDWEPAVLQQFLCRWRLADAKLPFKRHKSENRRPMRIAQVSIFVLLLALIQIETGSRDAQAIWDSRCEECHGDPTRFANKFLWNMEGQLQGQHHIDDLHLFMGNHYIPDHEIDAIRNMLLSQANSPVRFKTECSGCHSDAKEFVGKSLWVSKNGITGLETGKDLSEFLPTHQDLQPEDVIFYQKLFARIAGKPFPRNTRPSSSESIKFP
jgi:hypothetical protein